jgi:hypothetical protein
MPVIEQYQIFELSRDLNPVVLAGMMGTVLEILEPDKMFEVEFVKDDTNNYEYEGRSTFTITIDDILK